jgi:hypothetical protein
MTAILPTDALNGRMPPWFFNRTMAFRSASRASCLCAFESFSDMFILE